MELNSGKHDARIRYERTHSIQVPIPIVERRAQPQWKKKCFESQECGDVDEDHRASQTAQCPKSSPDIVSSKTTSGR